MGLELISAPKFARNLSSFDDSQLSDSELKFYFQHTPVATDRLPAQFPPRPGGPTYGKQALEKELSALSSLTSPLDYHPHSEVGP